MQTEEGITDVLQRARQRRLQRRTATHSDAVAGATSSSSLKHIGPASLGTQSMRPGMREE